MQEIIEAIFHLLRTGCPWPLLPGNFPLWRTIYRWFCTLRDDGIFERLNHHLVQTDRIRTGGEPMLSAAVINSQSAKTTKARGPRSYDAGKLERRSWAVNVTPWSIPMCDGKPISSHSNIAISQIIPQ
jgi:transposase